MATRKTTKTRTGTGTSRKKTPSTTAETPTREVSTQPPTMAARSGELEASQPLTQTTTTTFAATSLAPVLTARQVASLNLAGAIEVGTRPAESVIVRDGIEVKAPALSRTRVEAFVERLQPIVAFNTPRVVQQSVAPGTRVAKGSTVDLALVAPQHIRLNLLENSHTSFQNMTVQAAAPIVQSAKAILDRRATAAEMTTEERSQLQGLLAQNNIPVDDQNPATSMDAAFRTLQGAKAYS